MVDAKIKKMLESLGVPVSRLFYQGDEDTFITFQLASGTRTNFADDENEGWEYIYHVDVLSKKDYTSLLESVLTALVELECDDITIGTEGYEYDIGCYHVPITFRILEV